MRKLTYDEVKLAFETKGCTLLSTEYINAKSKLKYICACGEIREAKQRPGQSEFREMVLERDNYTCQICDHHDPCGEFLIAHHVDPVVCNPIESMDIDNGIALCRDCHKHAHSLPGCSFQELSKVSI